MSVKRATIVVRVIVRCLSALDHLKLEGDQRVGVNIIQRALVEPLRQIANNAGRDGSVILERVRQEKGSFGFDASREEYCDLFEAGIVDPTKVTRSALQNAASVAGLMLTTEVMLTEFPE